MTTKERRYATLLRKKETLDRKRAQREEEIRAQREREEAERLRLETRQAEEWDAGVNAIEIKKQIIAEMISIGDWDGLRRELVEHFVNIGVSWGGPIIAGVALVGLPLAREIILNWSEPVGVLIVGGLFFFVGKKVWRYYRPTPEDLEEELWLLETELEINNQAPNNFSSQTQSQAPREITTREISQSQVQSQAPREIITFTRDTDLRQSNPLNRTILDVVMESHKPHFMIVGETRSGKTTLVRHIIKARYHRGDEILICDPHNVKGSWGPLTVRGGGANWDEYEGTLSYLMERMNTVLAQLNTGEITESTVSIVTAYFGEWPWAVQEMGDEAVDMLVSLIMGGAKCGIRLIIDTQSERVESLGIKGKGDLRDSLARVRLALGGRNGGTYTARYNGQKVRTAGPFEGWQDLLVPPPEMLVPPPEMLVPPPEMLVPPPERLPSTEINVISRKMSEKAPNSTEIKASSRRKSGEVEKINVTSRISTRSLYARTYKKLFELGEDANVVEEVLALLNDDQEHTLKDLTSVFANQSGRRYSDRKEVVELIIKINEAYNE